MLSSSSAIMVKVAELRGAFDRERAAPVSARAEEQMENLLAIRVSGDGYAMRISEISGLTASRKIVALPSPVSGLLGVAGIRGTLVPVYNLSSLLGYSAEKDAVRWLALCGTEDCIALAFSDLESYLRIPQAQLYLAEKSDAVRTHVTHVARTIDMIRAVVSIPLLRATIQDRCRGSVPNAKER